MFYLTIPLNPFYPRIQTPTKEPSPDFHDTITQGDYPCCNFLKGEWLTTTPSGCKFKDYYGFVFIVPLCCIIIFEQVLNCGKLVEQLSFPDDMNLHLIGFQIA